MHIAVTGAGGFLGIHLIVALKRAFAGARLTGIVRTEPAEPIEGVRYLREPCEADLVFHLAGSKGIAYSIENPEADLEANAAFTVRMLEALRGAGSPTIILASSCAVYGAVDGEAREDMPLQPISPYAVSKIAAENYVLTYHRHYRLKGCVARISNPYGPGQKKLVIYELAKRALSEGAPLRLKGDGTEVRDFIHAEDVARALITIALRGEGGGVYNVGSGEPMSLRRVARLIAEATGLPAKSVNVDGKAEPGKVRAFFPSVRRLEGLDFRAAHTIDDGIVETVEWVRKEG